MVLLPGNILANVSERAVGRVGSGPSLAGSRPTFKGDELQEQEKLKVTGWTGREDNAQAGGVAESRRGRLRKLSKD